VMVDPGDMVPMVRPKMIEPSPPKRVFASGGLRGGRGGFRHGFGSGSPAHQDPRFSDFEVSQTRIPLCAHNIRTRMCRRGSMLCRTFSIRLRSSFYSNRRTSKGCREWRREQ
jgi:hypothetical protein